MTYVAVFFTHSGAVKYNRYLKKQNINAELMPVPRKLSSNCGIGVKFDYNEDISSIISDDIEKLFSLENKAYALLYTCTS